MRGGARFVAFALVLSVQSAWAQGSGMGPAIGPQPGSGQAGVDIWSTLYPRPVQSTQIEPASTRQGDPDASQPLGVPSGPFVIVPSITGAAFYDDNVFARRTNREGDWAYVLRPEIGWRSNNWSNAQINGGAFVEKRWYSKFASEDVTNFGVGTGGTYQPDANTQLVGRVQYLHGHEDRGTSDSITNTFTSPVSYDQLEAAGAINKRFDRFWTSIGAAAAWIRFTDPTLNGVTISQAYRNGEILSVPARLGYVVAPSTSVFVEVAGNRRNFNVDSFDSRGYRVVGGMLFEPGQGTRVKGEFFAGYMNQNYSGIGFQTVSTWTIGSALAFLVAPNVTAVLESRRDAKEASLSGGVVPGDGVSVIQTVVAGRMDFRVAPKVVLGGGVGYVVDEFLGAGRTDRSWSPLFSAKYFATRNLTLGFDYRYLNFDSSGLNVANYYKNVYLFSANLRM